MTLRDYLRVVSDYRLLILLVTLAGGAAALLSSIGKDPVYEASAAISFQDETRDFGIIGVSNAASRPPAQVAATKATIVTRPEVVEQARRELDTTQPVASLAASITTAVDPGSALVAVTARSDEAEFASALANAVARAAVETSNEDTRRRFAKAAETLRRESSGDDSGDSAIPGSEILYSAELARLDSLATFARSAQLVRTAGTPAKPVSPKPVRSAALGLIGGLLAGLLLAFLRDTLDRRLRTAADIQSHFKLPVLGHVREEGMGRIAYVDNGFDDDASLDLEAFRILRRNLDFLEPGSRLRSIVVTSALPEEGKTTVSASLAFIMAVAGKSTLLVECDLRRPVLAGRLGVAQSPGLNDYLAGRATPREILRPIEFRDAPARNGARPNGDGADVATHSVVCIPASSSTPHAAELLGSQRLRDFLAQVTKAYDVVVLDSSPILPVADTLELLPHVDGMIVCARENQTTRDQARAVRAALDHLPHPPVGLVVTGTRPHEGDYETYAYSYASAHV